MSNKDSKKRFIQNSSIFLALCLIISFLLHLLSIVNLHSVKFNNSENNIPPKIELVDPSELKQLMDEELKQIVEVEQEKTEAPKDAKFSGVVDHKTDRETRVDESIERIKGADAGKKGDDSKQISQKPTTKKSENKKIDASSDFSRAFDNLLPSMRGGSPTAGYFDFVMDKSIEIGELIDLNTTENRFIGFFSNMRKSIELAWVYPSEAVRRGMQGSVNLEFTVHKNGRTDRIQIRKSSGYEILDKAIVEAIRIAQPFSPLPETYKKDKMTVKATFVYVLRSNVAH